MKKTKVSRRASNALDASGYLAIENPAIALLVAFAAQNSGIDRRNYFSDSLDWKGRRNFRQESTQITRDWVGFRKALCEARQDGVVDADVINASPRAFSGRLSWNQDHWEYCTGQYFCVEYRQAAIAVLTQAARAVRQTRPAQSTVVRTIKDLRAINRRNGKCWFDRDTMNFFGTWIESDIIHGRYFITSEQPPHGPRMFSVRSFDAEGTIETVGEFCGHATHAEARAAVPAATIGRATQ